MDSRATQKTKGRISRTPESILGIIGAVIGLIVAAFLVLASDWQSAFGGTGEVSRFYGWVTVLFAAVGAVAAFFINSRTKLAGALLLISGVGGFLMLQSLYIVPGILCVIAGAMCLLRSRQTI